jgi:magnesium transporter
MVKKYTYKDVTWIDLESPTNEEVRVIMEEYNIHPLVAQTLVSPNIKPSIDVYEDFISLVLNFPAWKHTHKDTVQEMDFIIGKKYIVTARYDRIDAIDKFAKMFEVNSVLENKNRLGAHAGSVFFYMIKELYSSLDDELESLRDVLTDIEKKIFSGHEKRMVLKLSNVSRELLSFKHALSLHESILGNFGISAIKIFGENYSKSVEEIMGEYTKISKAIQGHYESLHELRETNNALLEAKQSEIMKTFTAITVISSFLTIISSWFLVEAPDRPFAEERHEFWMIGLVMLIVAIVLAVLMRWRKWL